MLDFASRALSERSMSASQRARALAERSFDPLVLTAVGGVAFVGSATHVYELASAHGQHGASAWEVTALTEVLFAYSGVDLRRRAGWWKAAPAIVMLAMCGFMVWANLASTLDRSTAGLLIAVWPAVVFVLNIALAETPRGERSQSARALSALSARVSAERSSTERSPLIARVHVETPQEERERLKKWFGPAERSPSAQPERSALIGELGEEWLEPVELLQGAHLRAVPLAERPGGGVGSATARVSARPTPEALAAHLASADPSARALAEQLGIGESTARKHIAKYRKGEL